MCDQFAGELDALLSEIQLMLLSKNEAYGDSAMNPIRVFSRADPDEQLRVRIDDKISRITRGKAAGEDVLLDLIGYLLILLMLRRRWTAPATVHSCAQCKHCKDEGVGGVGDCWCRPSGLLVPLKIDDPTEPNTCPRWEPTE